MLDFDRKDLPWLDLPLRPIDDYVESLDLDEESQADLRYGLLNWTLFGYAVVPNAVSPELCDAVLADIDELLANHHKFHTMVDSEMEPYRHCPIQDVDDEVIRGYLEGRCSIHMRIQDFIHNSIAAKKISLHPNITSFLEHVFQDRMVAFQSLNFIEGSEQPIHQDYAYVPAEPRARLAASWVALEDVHPDSGPLAYYPGSHHLRKFDWGDGLYKLPGVARNEIEFQEHIRQEAQRAGLPKLTFCPRKGDAFLWHTALAHGGSPVNDRSLTRRSHVTHYGPASTHLAHVHSAGKPGERVEYPGGFAMRHPLYPDEDDAFRNGANL